MIIKWFYFSLIIQKPPRTKHINIGFFGPKCLNIPFFSWWSHAKSMLRANLPFGQIGACQLGATTHFAIWTWPFSRSTDNSSLRSSFGLYFKKIKIKKCFGILHPFTGLHSITPGIACLHSLHLLPTSHTLCTPPLCPTFSPKKRDILAFLTETIQF